MHIPELDDAHKVCNFLSKHVNSFYNDLQKKLVCHGLPISIIPSEHALMNVINLMTPTGINSSVLNSYIY